MNKTKKKLGIILGTLVLIILGVYLLRNTLIEYFGEKIGTQKYGAKIDIDDVDLDLFGGDLKVGRVQITDKANTMRNIGDIKNINLEVEYKPLLKKLIVIDDATFGLVEIFTPREEDGAVLKKSLPIPKISDPTVASENAMKIDINTLDVDLTGDDYKKILDDLNIKIVKEYEVEKEKIEKIYTHWDKKLNGESYKSRVKNIEDKYKIVEKRVEEEKNPLKLLNELDKLNDLVDEIDGLVKEAEKDKKQFEKDLKTVKEIQEKAFDYINSEDLFKDIVGWDEKALKSEINLILNNYLKEYIGKNIDFFNKFNKQDEAPKGESFDLWLKKASLTFKHQKYTLKGGIKDLTSKKGISPKPIRFDLDGDNKSVRGNIIGELSRETEKANMKLNLSGVEIDEKMIGENKNLMIIVGSKMNLSYNMVYGNKVLDIDGRVILDNLKINLDQLGLDSKIKGILGEELQGVEQFIIDYDYKGLNKKLEFETNIGNIVSNLIKQVVDENIKKYKLEAKHMIDKEIKKYTEELNLEIEKVEGFKDIIGENTKGLEVLEKETKLNKDSKSTSDLIDGLGDGLKNLFN